MAMLAGLLLVVTLLAMPGTAQAQTNLIENGSFEDPVNNRSIVTHTKIPGWQATAGDFDTKSTFWQPHEGSQSIDIVGGSPATIEQTSIPVVSGSKYDISFYMSSWPGQCPKGSVTLEVESSNGIIISELKEYVNSTNTKSDMQWVERTASFTADDNSVTLRYISEITCGNGGAFGTPLDNVVMTAAPTTELTHVKSASLDDTVAGTDGVADANDQITYTFTLENTGAVDLTNVSVADDTNFSGTGTLPTPTLNGDGSTTTTNIAAGQAATFQTTYTLTQGDIDAGEITNQALASADELTADVVSDTGTATDGATISNPLDNNTDSTGETDDDPTVLTLTAAPELTLVKSADTGALSSPAQVGEQITYTFTVENTGNV
jgi:hypothetical protein